MSEKPILLYEAHGEVADEETLLRAGYVPASQLTDLTQQLEAAKARLRGLEQRLARVAELAHDRDDDTLEYRSKRLGKCAQVSWDHMEESFSKDPLVRRSTLKWADLAAQVTAAEEQSEAAESRLADAERGMPELVDHLSRTGAKPGGYACEEALRRIRELEEERGVTHEWVPRLTARVRQLEAQMDRALEHVTSCALDRQAFTEEERRAFGMIASRFKSLHEAGAFGRPAPEGAKPGETDAFALARSGLMGLESLTGATHGAREPAAPPPPGQAEVYASPGAIGPSSPGSWSNFTQPPAAPGAPLTVEDVMGRLATALRHGARCVPTSNNAAVALQSAADELERAQKGDG